MHYLEPLSLTVTELARDLLVSRKHLSEIVNGRASVTVDLALRLGKALGTSPELWVNLQRAHDLWHAAHDTHEWKRVREISHHLLAA